MSTGGPDYGKVIRRLMPPTLAQTERFARFVSSAHSWYKHLPVEPKVRFIFYLDTGAGMHHVRTATGETALVEIADESTRFHYTWQKTADYRRRFGYWNYHAAYGNSFMFQSDGGMVSTAGAGLKILLEGGAWVAVPPELAEKGTALVSACVHPFANISMWMRDPARFGLAPKSGVPFADPMTLLAALQKVIDKDRHCYPDFSRLEDLLPARVRELIRQTATRQSRDHWTSHQWDWPDEYWLEQLQASLIGNELVSLVVKYVEFLAVQGQAENGSADRQAHLQIAVALSEERGRQLTAMTKAMNRFAEAVYAQ